jgi:ferredoxin
MQYDVAQYEMARAGEHYEVPVVTLGELMAVAFGLPLDELGLELHRVPVRPVLERAAGGVAPGAEQLRAQLDRGALRTCIACQACSRDCPVHKLDPTYNPWVLFQRVLDGDLEGALRDRALFKCAECYECYERCFQHWGMIAGIRALKRLAIERGWAPEGVEKGLGAFARSGVLTQPSAARRRQLGLPPTPKPATEELHRLLRGLAGQGQPDKPSSPPSPRDEGQDKSASGPSD